MEFMILAFSGRTVINVVEYVFSVVDALTRWIGLRNSNRSESVETGRKEKSVQCRTFCSAQEIKSNPTFFPAFGLTFLAQAITDNLTIITTVLYQYIRMLKLKIKSIYCSTVIYGWICFNVSQPLRLGRISINKAI